jgi:hypothetical protein
MTSAHRSSLNRDALAAILGKQYKVVSWRQARTCGMTGDMLHRWSGPEGRWQRLLPGVYLAVTGTPTVDQRDMAALLYAGPSTVITGPAALRRKWAPRSANRDRRRADPGHPTTAEHRLCRHPSHHEAALPGLRHGIQFALAPRAVADAARGLASLPRCGR